MSSPDLLRRIVLPIASREDAHDSCKAAFPYIANANGEVIAVYVVETTPGGINKASPAALTDYGEQILEIVKDYGNKYALPIQSEIQYGSIVREVVFDVAQSEEATSIGFVPRSGSRIGKLLRGDKARSLITQNEVPVLVFPRPERPSAENEL